MSIFLVFCKRGAKDNIQRGECTVVSFFQFFLQKFRESNNILGEGKSRLREGVPCVPPPPAKSQYFSLSVQMN